MLTFKLISSKDGIYHYEIYPEGRIENKGWIVFDTINEKILERVEPKSPFNCIAKFFQGVANKDGSFKEFGMVAWY